MKQFALLVKLMTRNLFRRSSEKGSRKIVAYIVAFGILYLFIAGGMVLATVVAGSIFGQFGMQSQLVTVLLSIGSLAVLLFGLTAMLNVIYFSKDTEFLMALPVKPATVYMAKLFTVYLCEAGLSIALLLPCLITAGICMHCTAVYYIVMLFAMVLAPAFPLLLASLIAIPLMFLVSFFRNKGVLSSIVLILLFALFFGGYMLLLNQIGPDSDTPINPEDLAAIIVSMQPSLNTLCNVLTPLSTIARVATLTAAWGLPLSLSIAVDLAIFIGCTVLLFGLTVLISNAVYKRSAERMLESGKRKVKDGTTYASSGVIKSLMKKEWRELIRTPAFAFQSLAGVILCPLFVVIMGLTMNSGASGGAEDAAAVAQIMPHILTFFLLGFIVMLGIGMNIGASTCISREGVHFSDCKMIPVSARDQVRAKSYVYLIVCGVTVLLGAVVMPIAGVLWWNIFPALGFLLIYGYGYTHFTILFDLKSPKLHWATPNEAVKQNNSAIIPMLINMGVSVVLIALPIVCILFIPMLWVAELVSWIILYAIAIAAAAVFPALLYNNAERLFAQLTV